MAVDWNDPKQVEFNNKITDIIFPHRRAALKREGERHAEFMRQFNASKGLDQKPKNTKE